MYGCYIALGLSAAKFKPLKKMLYINKKDNRMADFSQQWNAVNELKFNVIKQ